MCLEISITGIQTGCPGSSDVKEAQQRQEHTAQSCCRLAQKQPQPSSRSPDGPDPPQEGAAQSRRRQRKQLRHCRVLHRHQNSTLTILSFLVPGHVLNPLPPGLFAELRWKSSPALNRRLTGRLKVIFTLLEGTPSPATADTCQ